MKVIACLAAFSGCVIIGLVVYLRAKSKVRFFASLSAFCNNLSTEISFALTPVSQIIDKYREAYCTEFDKVLNSYQRLIAKKEDITREKCLGFCSNIEAADFFYNLGRSGAMQEKDKITNAVKIFDNLKANAEKDLHGRASVTLKILIIMGITCVILLL
jgi:hypothetical protein